MDEALLMATPESTWLAEYRRGDVEALGKLVEHCRRPLFGFILKMTEGREDADEIFQETWFRALKHLDTYREDRFLSWMFRIAHNLIIDRARRARPVVDIAATGAEGEDPIEARLPDAKPGPAAEAAGRDLGRRIGHAVDRLPPEQKEVFLMRTSGDLPFKDIAKIQGVSINTALARMQYALAKLREDLKDEYSSITGAEP